MLLEQNVESFLSLNDLISIPNDDDEDEEENFGLSYPEPDEDEEGVGGGEAEDSMMQVEENEHNGTNSILSYCFHTLSHYTSYRLILSFYFFPLLNN